MEPPDHHLLSLPARSLPAERGKALILVLAPTSNDGTLTSRFLRQAGLTVAVCADFADLGRRLGENCGALLLAEEAITRASIRDLVEHLDRQPSWSDLPVIIITGTGESARIRPRYLAALGPVGNVSIIERPVRPETLVTACQVALRSRAKQYEVRELLEERDRLVSEAQQQARIYDTTLSSIHDFTCTFDRHGCFLYANRPLLELFQLELADVVGRTFRQLPYPPELAERLQRQVEQVLLKRQVVRDEISYLHPDGVTRFHEYIFNPVLGPDGQVEVVAGSTRDTSVRRRSEEALLEAARRKDEFLAMLAHELRNPLAAVSSAVSILRSCQSSERQWATGVIERQSGQLGRLIDDLLDMTRINTGKVRLRREVVDAARILDQARDSVRPLVEERGHQMHCSWPEGALWLDADPTRLEQIVFNLLTNAIKYTPAGGRIELTARRTEQEVELEVRDNGIGISPERLPEMFQLFAQGERSIARSEGGLGVGLTIVQRLVDLHGGRIDAHSGGPNCGSTFRVLLPAAEAPAPVAAPGASAPPEPPPGRRVLIVDDNIDTAVGMARLLTRAGHRTELAHDGFQALARTREFNPDVIVLDIGLPGMDGFEVVRRLRVEPTSAGAVMIAVTGYGQQSDRDQALEAGFDHHLVKPVDFAELKGLLSGFR